VGSERHPISLLPASNLHSSRHIIHQARGCETVQNVSEKHSPSPSAVIATQLNEQLWTQAIDTSMSASM